MVWLIEGPQLQVMNEMLLVCLFFSLHRCIHPYMFKIKMHVERERWKTQATDLGLISHCVYNNFGCCLDL